MSGIGPNDRPRRSLAVVVAGLGTAVLFEALTLLATQDRTVRTASPWQDDPYDLVVGLAQFTVPMLALVTGLRLLAWRLPGGVDRVAQMLRAMVVLVALVGSTAVVEWVAVAAGAHSPLWMTWTGLLIAGLAVLSVLTVALSVVLVGSCRSYPVPGGWRQDWLGDAVMLCARLPLLRRWATPLVAAWLRGHAMRAFVASSLFAAVAMVGATAVNERWTDPLLIGWAAVVVTAANLAFCVTSNAVAGFICRPPRTPARQATETALVVGSVALQVAVAFRDTLWRVVSPDPLDSVPPLAAFTVGTGLVAFAGTAVILRRRYHAAPAEPR